MTKYIFALTINCMLVSGSIFGMEIASSLERAPFIRILISTNKRELQTASKIYISKDNSFRITLLAATHFGEKAYYDQHQKLMNSAEAVLYEGGEKSTLKPYLGSSLYQRSPQKVMAQNYDLCCQLEAIDYEKGHFFWADNLTYPTLDIQNAPLFTEFLLLINSVYAWYSGLEKFSETLCAPRIAINDESKWFEQLMLERNAIAYEKLEEQLKQGKRHIVIYYGEAHMEAMENFIVEKYDLVIEKVDWYTAWHYEQSWAGYAAESFF